MYFPVTGPTDDQRFSLSCSHQLDPCWPFPSSLSFEVCQFAYVGDFNVFRRLAEFTGIGQHSLQNFCPCVHWLWELVENGCFWGWDELQPSKLGDQRLLSFAFHHHP